MTENLKSKIEIVKRYFEGFSSYIELHNFREYLLFTLNSQVSSNVLAQLGLGGNRDVINLPYDPEFNMFFQKINMLSSGALIIYFKTEPLFDKFILEKTNPVFKEFLNQNEIDLAFRGKEKFLIPKVSDCSSINNDDKEPLDLKIDDIFYDVDSFMAMTEPNILFVIDAKTDTEADLLFTFNMMPEMPGTSNKKSLKIDVFLDKEHITKGKTYLKREEDYKVSFLSDIKEVSHSDLYKSAFSLVIHIKSLKKP